MKTIEEQIEEFARKLTPCGICHRKGCRVEIEDCAWYKDIYEALAEVAKLQKEIDEEVRLKKSDDMTKVEYDREVAFAEWYSENGKGTPTFSDAIEWARKGMIDIDKACAWFEKYLAEIGYPDDWCRDSEVQESGEKRFRKAMEE